MIRSYVPCLCHIENIHQLKSPCYTRILITKNAPCHLNLSDKIVFLGSRNFIEDKNSSRPLDRHTGKVTIKFCIPSVLSSQGSTKQQMTPSIAFLSVSSDRCTSICRRRSVPAQQMYSHGASGRCTCSGDSQDVSLHTAADSCPALSARPVSLAT